MEISCECIWTPPVSTIPNPVSNQTVHQTSLRRAAYYEAVDVTTIKHIVEQKLYLLEMEPILPKEAGEVPVMGRDLSYYTVVYDANSLPGAA